MTSAVVVALGHRFADLNEERQVLEPAGYQVIDGTVGDAHTRLAKLKDAVGVLLGSRALTGAEYAALVNCRALVRYGVGIDNVDVHETSSRGIAVSRVPDYATEDVALHTVSLILALARRLPEATRTVADGRWSLETIEPPHRPSAQTLGIVGLGRIGVRVAELAIALGFNVLGFDPVSHPDSPTQAPSLDDLLRQANVLTLHLPLVPATTHLIGERELSLLPNRAIVINTARGGLIDEAALGKSISAGHVAGAGLDVFSSEPPAHDHPLINMNGVILTPHMAWYSIQALASVKRQAAEELRRILENDGPQWVVS